MATGGRLAVVVEGCVYEWDRISFILEFFGQDLAVDFVVRVSGAIPPEAAKLATGDVIHPSGMVATGVVNKGIACSRFDEILGIYSFLIMAKFKV